MANGTFNCEVIFSSNKASVQNIVNTLQKEVDKIDLGSKAGQQVLKQFEKLKQKQVEMGLYEDNAASLSPSEISKYLSLMQSFNTAVNNVTSSFSKLTIQNGLKVDQTTLDSLKQYDELIRDIQSQINKLGKGTAESAVINSLNDKTLRDHFSGGKNSPYKNQLTKQSTLAEARAAAVVREQESLQKQQQADQVAAEAKRAADAVRQQQASLSTVESLQASTFKDRKALQSFLEQAAAAQVQNILQPTVTPSKDTKVDIAQAAAEAAKVVTEPISKVETQTLPEQQETISLVTNVAKAAAQMVADNLDEQKSNLRKIASTQQELNVLNLSDVEAERDVDALLNRGTLLGESFFLDDSPRPLMAQGDAELERELRKDIFATGTLTEEMQQIAKQRYEAIVQSLLTSGILKADTEGNATNAVKRGGQQLLNNALTAEGFSPEIVEAIIKRTKERLTLIQKAVEQQVFQQNQLEQNEIQAQAAQAVAQAQPALNAAQMQTNDVATNVQVEAAKQQVEAQAQVQAEIAKQQAEAAAKARADATVKQQKIAEQEAIKSFIGQQFSEQELNILFNKKGALRVDSTANKDTVSQKMAGLGFDESTIQELMGRTYIYKALEAKIRDMYHHPEQYQQAAINRTAQQIDARNAEYDRYEKIIEDYDKQASEASAQAAAYGADAQAAHTDVNSIDYQIAALETKLKALQEQLEKLMAERNSTKAKVEKPESGTAANDTFQARMNMSAAVQQMYQERVNEERAEKAKTEAQMDVERFQSGLSSGIKQWMGITQVINTVRRGIREAYQDIKNLDQSMTNIAVVTDMSVDDLWGKIDEYMAVAQQYGVTTQGVYEVSQLFYQQGNC